MIPTMELENFNEVARQLKEDILTGQLNEVQKLLGPVTNAKVIKLIEDRFMCLFDPQIDPVNFAINCGKQKLAVYLVEKAFPLHHVYWEEKAACDEWCYKDHGPDDCPRQYNASKNAEKHKMEALKLRIDQIRQGIRRPGEGLSEPYIENFMPRPAAPIQQKPRIEKPSAGHVQSTQTEKTAADEARKYVSEHGTKYTTKRKGTLLHTCMDKPRVFIYVLANFGVPINVQNTNGDTALHLAVRARRLDLVEALVQCSADISLKNMMGQTPMEEADEPMKSFLHTFNPGVVVAVRDGKHNMLYKLYTRSWCNVHTKIKVIGKENKSLFEWTQMKAEGAMLTDSVKATARTDLQKQTDAARNSLRILSDYRQTSELIHAVLCEDVQLTQTILESSNDPKVNLRFRDRLGKTLLSHAIEVNNLHLVKLLVNYGAKVSQIRVREVEESDVTVPLYQKALRRDIDINIVKLLQTVLPDNREHEEKDMNGNTPLLRAIQEGMEARVISWLLRVRGGYSLLDRNKAGLTARDMAEQLERKDIVTAIDKVGQTVAEQQERNDIVTAIDKFILKEVDPLTLMLLPVGFYGSEFLTIVDEQSGTSLEEKINKAAEDRNMKSLIDAKKTEEQAIQLFNAAATGDLENISKLCDANYKDRNGYTALTRAIVFNQLEAAKRLCLLKPALKKMGDNCNRYPLHYAYALPQDQGEPFLRLLLDRDAAEIEQRVDKAGRVTAVYKGLRQDIEIRQMMFDARTLDAYGKRGHRLGRWPPSADTEDPQLEQTQ